MCKDESLDFDRCLPVPPLAYIEEALMRSSPPCAWYSSVFQWLAVGRTPLDGTLAAAPGRYKHDKNGSELDGCFREHVRSHLLQVSGYQRPGAPLPVRPSHPEPSPDGAEGGAPMSCQLIRFT